MAKAYQRQKRQRKPANQNGVKISKPMAKKRNGVAKNENISGINGREKWRERNGNQRMKIVSKK
jgi:hypothetical protein